MRIYEDGYVVWGNRFDTPVENEHYFNLRPFANHCRFPDCTHTHEADCAVKHAVADGLLDTRRWESCCHLAGTALAADAGEFTEEDH